MSLIFEKFCIFSWCFIWPVLSHEIDAHRHPEHEANLTSWREHRRQKRFILFENAGISKLVTGITYPVDLSDKRPWRQLVLTFNIQYQFPVPPRPIYYWDKWDEDRAVKTMNAFNIQMSAEAKIPSIDEAQMFLYRFAVELMNRNGMNGVACLQKAICENAQLHGHDGLFAELVYRFLTPHNSLDAAYSDAFTAGQKGLHCDLTYAVRENCLFNNYLHIREEIFQDE